MDSPFDSITYTKQIQMISSLRKIAKSGVSVISLLENPRFEILMSFDNLILMGKGGKKI